MKVEIICEDNKIDLVNEVNEFIADKNIVDIKYSITSHGYGVYHSALIIYND